MNKQPSAPRMALLRQRRAALGIKAVTVFIPERDRQALKDFARALLNRYNQEKGNENH